MSKKCKLSLLLSLVLLLATTSTVSAYVALGGKWSDASNLNYWKDASVSQYGYSSHIDHGASQWNGVSSKVKLNNVTTGYVHIKVYAGDTGSASDVGDTLNYKVDWLGNLTPCWNCSYATSVIRINDPVAKNLTPTRVNKTGAHEFGHSLGFDDNNSGTKDSIMKQGDLGFDTIKQDDKDGLIAVYGK